MSKSFAAFALVGLMTASSAAFAEGLDFTSVDGNQDGFVSFDELATVVPTITEEVFLSVDVDSDKVLNPDEFAALAL